MHRKKRTTIALGMAALLCLSGCGTASVTETQIETAASSAENITEDSRELFAMDTYMTLKAFGTNAEKALDAAEEEIERLDDMFSVGNTESEVTILNEAGSEILSEETAYLMKTSLELYDTTDGSFDIAIYPLMEEWGFTTQDYKVPSAKTIKKLLKYTDASEIEYNEESGLTVLPEHMAVDFGGIAKGYTSSRIMEIFKEYDVDCGIISLGGNVQAYKQKTDGSDWNVAIQDPEDSASYVGTVKVHDKAVITSGGYERYFEEDGVTYHHILNPETGYPADSGLTSVSIISPEGTTSDGLSTALFVMGKDKAVEFWEKYKDTYDFEMILIEEDGSITITDGLKATFTSDREYSVVD